MHMPIRSDAEMLKEADALLTRFVRDAGYALPSANETGAGRVLMLARALAFRWPADDAPTAKIPPVRESLGVRRRPPAPMVQELSDRVDLLRAIVDELAAYDDAQDDQP